MNIYSEVLRSGLKKQVRLIDYKIYLWSSERNVSKREIKEYARKVFVEEGFTDFKASDGWYRRWFKRWKKDSTLVPKKTDNVNNKRLTSEHHKCKILNNDECISNSSSKISNNDVDESSQSIDPLLINQNEVPSVNINLNEIACLPTITEDCIKEINGLHNVSKYNNKITNKKKGERYLPHFKAEVVSYAKKYSIKEAAFFYKVNKGTVSDWIRNSNQSSIEKINNNKSEINPDEEFIKWLKDVRQKDQVLDKNILANKIQELIQPFIKSEISKSSQWFFNYSKRFDNDSLEKTPNIMYPTAFKIELALFCETFSKNELSDLFKVDRKRIRDWFNLFSEGKLKDIKRSVNNYLTDERIDKEIWCWYDMQIIKPTHKQVV
ncbi:hypothetical protein O3M35_010262 [Rhynocoris fuscipes]|uniref:HTH CENPB-type domain-containing protein n=1 Tax=Rhynocoris fuscipes TaxID=488301 RepID=A0AAW1D1F3_9HEMI